MLPPRPEVATRDPFSPQPNHNIAHDGWLNLPPLPLAPPPAMSRPKLTPRVPEPEEADDVYDEPHDPRSAEQCIEDAYAFGRQFRMRGEPPPPHEEYDNASPRRKAVSTKRWNSRAKRPQHPESAQRQAQWAALLRRARRAAATGNVSVSFLFLPVRVWAVVLGKIAHAVCIQVFI